MYWEYLAHISSKATANCVLDEIDGYLAEVNTILGDFSKEDLIKKLKIG